MNLSWVALSKRTRLVSLSLVFPLDHFFFFCLTSRWLGWLSFSSLCLLLWWHFFFFALPPDGLVGLAFPPFACCFGGIF